MNQIYSEEERKERHKVSSLKWYQRYRKEHKEEYNAKVRAWRLKNKEKHNLYQKEYRSRTGKYHGYKIKSLYGISVEEYKKLFDKQNGLCAICSKKEKINLCVDHEHTNGKIRGLLCKKCNLGIANFYDTIEYLEKAINYLRGAV